MPNFHRYVQPAYPGAPALPTAPATVAFNGVAYNLINVVSGGTGAGGSAFVDTAKSVGPNLGTLFTAFGEDALSLAANRGLRALAENTDFLDDIVNRALAVPTRTLDVVAAAPVGTIIITGPGIFVGAAGTPATVPGINTFLEILDDNDNEIVDPAVPGTRCVVTAIFGAVVGAGFSVGNVGLTIAPPIPAGKTYRVYYARRSSLAAMPIDTLVNVKIRSAQEVSAQLMAPTGAGLVGFGGSVPWVDGATNPQNTVEAQLDNIVATLASANGAAKVGMTLANVWADAVAPVGNSIQLKVNSIVGQLASTAPGVSGARKIGTEAVAGTLGEGFRNLPGGVVYNQLVTLLQHVNARVDFTVGDGNFTFGDYTGPTAITDAIVAWLAVGTLDTLYLQVKTGTYSMNGATGPTIPAGKKLILHGVDRDKVFIEGNTTDAHTFNIAGKLVLKDVTLRDKVGAPSPLQGVFTTGTGTLEVHHSNLIHQKLRFDNPSPTALIPVDSIFTPVTPILLVDNSILDMTGIVDITGAASNIDVFLSDGFAHRGFVIQSSSVVATDNNSPFKVKVGPGVVSINRLLDVTFSSCQIRLGSADSTLADYMVGNGGVFWADPNLTFNKLEIDNITWKDCSVISKDVGNTSILLQLVPYSIGFNAGADNGRLRINRVSIHGGKWVCKKGVSLKFSPFVVDASSLSVQDVEFSANNHIYGIAASNLISLTGAYGSLASVWSAFVFKASANAGTMLSSNQSSLYLSNIKINGLTKDCSTAMGGLGDATFTAGADTSIFVNDIDMKDVTTVVTGGFLPDNRIYVDSASPMVISKLAWGKFTGAALSAWCVSNKPIINLNCTASCRLESCTLRSPSIIGPAVQTGIGVGGSTPSASIHGCLLENVGIHTVTGYVAGLELSVLDNTILASNIRISIGNKVTVKIIGNKVRDFVIGPGIDMYGPWETSDCKATIVGNHLANCDLLGSSIHIRLENTTTNNPPACAVYGNEVEGDLAIQVKRFGGPLDDTGVLPHIFPMGLETGYAAIAFGPGTACVRLFTHLAFMKHNVAILFNT